MKVQHINGVQILRDNIASLIASFRVVGGNAKFHTGMDTIISSKKPLRAGRKSLGRPDFPKIWSAATKQYKAQRSR